MLDVKGVPQRWRRNAVAAAAPHWAQIITRRLPTRAFPAWALWVVVTVLLAGCGASGSGAAAPPTVASQGTTTRASTADVPLDCSNDAPCTLAAGTWDTGTSDVAFRPGMKLTLPSAWSSHSLNLDEFSFFPPSHPDERLFFWEDMVAVKSTGAGHGTTILRRVGTSPKAISSWLATNSDFHILSPPTRVTSVDGLTAIRLVLAVSAHAHYGDPTCPANPHCADLFTRRDNSEYYSIGGREQVRLDIASININGRPHTLFIALDAPAGRAELRRLTAEAQPILKSLRLHPDVTRG